MPKYRPNEFLDAQFVFPIKPLQGNQNNPKRFSNIFIVPSRNSIIRQEKNIIPPSYEKQAKTVPKSFLKEISEFLPLNIVVSPRDLPYVTLSFAMAFPSVFLLLSSDASILSFDG